ncbi:MAG: ABC transporter substrate-binding protein [Desulfobacteraceae bacterium]|jgi:branched-chain amino acid transport system substrate-binding protein|nr:ABC transporter substrate-binding protein [Desulfobacteraceae bacterium]
MRSKLIVLSMSLLVCFFIMSVCFTSAVAAEKKPIVIGHINIMSGAMSVYGISSAAAAQIAVDEINAAGGVLGRPLKVITRDSKLSPETGLREAKDLVLSQDAKFITGVLSSGVALGVAEYARMAKVPFITSIAMSAKLITKKANRYFFRFDVDTKADFGGPIVDEWFKRWPNAKRVMTIGFDYEGPRSCMKWFANKFLSYPGTKIVGQLWPPTRTSDYAAYVSKIMSSDIDGLVMCMWAGGEIAFLKQAIPAGLYEKLHVMAPHDGDTETWYNMRKGDIYPKGSIGCARYPYWLFNDERNKRFVKEHEKRTGIPAPSYGAANEYAIIYALKAAFEKAGSVDIEKAIDALEGMKCDTLVGEVLIRACDHQAILPIYVGEMGFGDGLPYPHITNGNWYRGVKECGYFTCEEVKVLRAKGKQK